MPNNFIMNKACGFTTTIATTDCAYNFNKRITGEIFFPPGRGFRFGKNTT